MPLNAEKGVVLFKSSISVVDINSSIRMLSLSVHVLLLGLLLIITVPSMAQQTGTKCPAAPGRSETCVCQSDKGIIDVTSLSRSDGTAMFTGLQDPNDYSYSYNPCVPYQGEYDCSKIHICQVSNFDPTQNFDVADPGTEEMWIDDDGTPYLYYTGPLGRVVKVFLNCDESADHPTATTEGDSAVILNYVFHVNAKEVCPGQGGGGGGPGLSINVGVAPGEIGIVIIFVIIPLGFISYFVAGALIMKYRFNATGTDIIPHKSFWMVLPFLVKDGCLFTFGPLIGLIRGKVSQRQGYESTG